MSALTQSSALDLVTLRRDLHAHPEIAFAEHRTTERIVATLTTLGLSPAVLPGGTGAVCDVGTGTRTVALRSDIDALPLEDVKSVPYRSTNPGLCHGCGHDAHTAILLGVAAQLAAAPPAGTVRLVFQPGEEALPGGAPSVLAAGVLDGVEAIYALHCDPRLDVGRVGLRPGPITAACDMIAVELSGAGGHTARPHLTQDVVYALGRLITDLPGVLSRRVDPRAALSLMWGAVHAGSAPNAIPRAGRLEGTLRAFGHEAWLTAEPLVRALIDELVAPLGVRAAVSYTRGVPPVVNTAECVETQRLAVLDALGPDGLAETAQSMGGEDFAWYLERLPGALARLGVRTPGGAAFDLHQGTFDIDERALAVGVRYTAALARHALAAAV